MVPKTAPKSSTSTLKSLIDDVYARRLKYITFLPRPWQTPLPVKPPQPHPRPLLLELDSIVSEARVFVASLPSLSLLPAADEAVSVSGVILVESFFFEYF